MKILKPYSFLAVIVSLLFMLTASSTVSAQINVTQVFPYNGIPGKTISIYGNGFDATATNNKVTFTPVGGWASTTVSAVSVSGGKLTVTLPTLAGGNYEISVQRSSDSSSDTAVELFSVTTKGGGDAGGTSYTTRVLSDNITSNDYGANSIVSGDVNGDGHLDLIAVSFYNDDIFWYKNNGAKNPSFTRTNIPGTLDGVYDVYPGDMDGDGDLDLVFATNSDDNLILYTNNGQDQPSWSSNEIQNNLDGARSVFGGDFDGDGDIDLVSAAEDDNTIAWHKNNNNGFFSYRLLEFSFDGASSVFAADLDGDGDLDLIAGSKQDGMIWYENDGASDVSFTKHSLPSSLDGIESIFAEDVDGDGDMDLITAAYDDNTVAWYENDGNADPTFTEHTISTTANGATGVHSADVDGDGDVDIIAAMFIGDKIEWYENDGNENPSFTTRTLNDDSKNASSVFAADLNGDGHIDLMTASRFSNNIIWYENKATIPLTISKINPITVTPSETVTLYGFGFDASLNITLNPSTGNSPTTIEPITFTDSTLTYEIPKNFSGGNYSLSITRANDNTSVTSPAIFSVSTGGGGFGSVGSSKNIVSTTPDRPFSVFGEDIDGDGDVDLLSASSLDDKVIWYENDGNQSFSENTITEDLENPLEAKAFDIDGDGDMDLIAASNDNASIIWYESDGASDPSFTSHIVNNISSGARGIHAADLDGDGDLDLISVAFDDDELAWHENDNGFGSVNSSTHVISTDVDGPQQVYADDIDGDGDIDLITASSSDNTIAWYENDGANDPSFTKIVINSSTSGPRSVYSGDVDGDGDVDVIAASFSNNRVAWFENDGTTDPSFTQQVVSTSASGIYEVFAGDVDGDGDLDLMSATLSNNSVTWYENDGASDPSFTTRVITNDALGATSVYAIDVDGDGDLDVISSSGNDDTIAWYENTASFSTPGQALTLDGTNDFISVPGVASHLGADPDFTFEAWVKPDMDNQAEGTGILFARNSSTTLNVLLIGIENTASSDSKQLRVFDQNSGNWEISGTQLTNNHWHHVAYTLSSGTGTLFLDGTQIGQHTLDINLSVNDTLSIGQEFDSGFTTGNFLLADVDEIRFWDVALTEAQIQQNMFQQLDGSEANLVSYWSLDEETGFEAKDGTANGYDGTMYGSPARSSDTHPYGTFVAGNEGWRMFTSPFGNASYGTLLDTLWTQGFTDADYSDGTSNVYVWDEVTQAFTSISNASDVPAQGTGFIVYVYDDVDNDETADGFPKMIKTDSTQNSGSIAPDLSYTDTGNSSDDGWNLVGNPYGATIDWDAASGLTSSNIDASFYVWSDSAGGGAGAYLSWNGTTGTFGGGEIAPWQGFWVKANAADPSVSLNDEARSAGGVLRKKAPVQELRFTLTGGELSSKAIVMFSDKASKEKDVLDAYKLQSLNTDYLSLFTQLDDGAALDINALPSEFEEELSLNLNIDGKDVNGVFELNWNPQNLPEGMDIFLVDSETNAEVDLTEASSYTFEIAGKAKAVKTQDAASPQHQVFSPKVMHVPSGKAKTAGSRFTIRINTATSVSNEPDSDLPTEVSLDQNYPNPFNPSTTIQYGVPESGKVTLEVFDMMGRKVATLLNGENKAIGRYVVNFNASSLASGMYIYRLKTGSTVMIKKLTLIK